MPSDQRNPEPRMEKLLNVRFCKPVLVIVNTCAMLAVFRYWVPKSADTGLTETEYWAANAGTAHHRHTNSIKDLNEFPPKQNGRPR